MKTNYPSAHRVKITSTCQYTGRTSDFEFHIVSAGSDLKEMYLRESGGQVFFPAASGESAVTASKRTLIEKSIQCAERYGSSANVLAYKDGEGWHEYR